MNKIKTNLILILIILFVTVQSALLVLWAERAKKIRAIQLEREYYQSLNSDFNKYLQDYQNQVAEIKKQNADKMVQAKQQFDQLMAQQPSLVAQHTKTVAQGTTTSSGSSVLTVTSNNSSGSSSVKVSAPKSTPKTKAS